MAHRTFDRISIIAIAFFVVLVIVLGFLWMRPHRARVAHKRENPMTANVKQKTKNTVKLQGTPVLQNAVTTPTLTMKDLCPTGFSCDSGFNSKNGKCSPLGNGLRPPKGCTFGETQDGGACRNGCGRCIHKDLVCKK